MSPTGARSQFIPEVQGLRTIALVLVATFHIWAERVSGGVDIFLLISAYLMTRSIIARAEGGKQFKPAAFLIKKFARLLPLSATVIVVTTVLLVLVLPLRAMSGEFANAFASLMYVENIHLQKLATDYVAANPLASSPFQHFWSLSIQGQVFVLWAMIHMIVGFIANRRQWSIRPALLTVFGAIAVASFSYALWLTSVNQPFAYFDTFARLWEFAAGSIVALVQPWLNLNGALRTIGSWLGLFGALSCGFILPVSGSFPGVAALWPVVSASFIILSAGEGARYSANKLLASAPLRTIGGYTYALYLTHWPTLIIFKRLTGTPHVDALQGLLVLAISLVAAIILVHLIERPIAKLTTQTRKPAKPSTVSNANESVRQRTRRTKVRQVVAIATCIAIGTAVSFAGHKYYQVRTQEELARFESFDPSLVGANAIGAEDIPLQINPSNSAIDWVRPGYTCQDGPTTDGTLCFDSTRGGRDNAAQNILAIGSSHMNQFAGTLKETVGRHADFELRTYAAPDCQFDYRDIEGNACAEIWKDADKYIERVKPDLIIVLATVSVADGQPDRVFEEFPQWIKRTREAYPETKIVAVRDNPRLNFEPIQCIEQNGADSTQCTTPAPAAIPQEYIQRVTDAGAIWVDLTPYICPSGTCQPVVGGVPVFLDTNHVTAAYQRTLAQHFADALVGRVEWWPLNAYEGKYVERSASIDPRDPPQQRPVT